MNVIDLLLCGISFGRCDGGSLWTRAYNKESEGIHDPWWKSDGPLLHHRHKVIAETPNLNKFATHLFWTNFFPSYLYLWKQHPYEVGNLVADSESNLLIISILGEYQFKTNRRSFLAKWGFWKSQEFFGTVSEKWAYVYYVVLVPNLMFFFFYLVRELLHTKKRQEDTHNHLKTVLGDAMISCDISMVGSEITACSQTSTLLPSAITREIFGSKFEDEPPSGLPQVSGNISVTMDNSLSPAHTLVQIVCQDHKGLLYDMMRTLKDYNIKVHYVYNPIWEKI